MISVMLQDVDHVYYTSKIYGLGDAASKNLWVSETDGGQWTVLNFLSNTHRHAEVSVEQPEV